MTLPLITICLAVVCWSLLAAKFEQWRVSAPILMVVAGVVTGFTVRGTLSEALNTDVALAIAELILAILLFVDATEVKGGLFGRAPRIASRLLLLAMPLSLAAAILVGSWLLPGLSWAVLLVVACVVVPIDFAPASWIVRDRKIPQRVRDALNVEGGYNDGIISPIFIFGLVLAGDLSHEKTPLDALGTAGPSALKALLVGIGIGAVLAWATNRCERRGLMSEQSMRIALTAVPVLTYAAATGIGGNGFVAAFIAGITYSYLRRSPTFALQVELIDDISFVLGIVMWFVFGMVSVLVVFTQFGWEMALFALATLTVIRVLPVVVSLTGSDVPRPQRWLVGWLGPRGTTSIVFGLLAFNRLGTDDAEAALTAMFYVVMGSLIVHSVVVPLSTPILKRRN
ncbi:cation:proton antiporter [Nocardia jejuensis]|uniref:cation:proton antiporter n=1 Tax=Nocardia jejuensis TaxID=328049 RepID=UPI000832E7E3|nr:cation:proton antiporter [Nocardia jejuensis]